jgi:hypothetical protein
MRLVLRRKASECKDFGNWNRSFRKVFHHRVTETQRKPNRCNGRESLEEEHIQIGNS